MKVGLLVVAAVALAFAAGCGESAQIETPSAEGLEQAETGCVEVVGNEYEEAQRPPTLDIKTTSYADGVITLTGVARGKTNNPAPYEFACRHSGGATVLASLERAEDEGPGSITSEKAVQMVDYPNNVQFAQRIELSYSIPLRMRATYASIQECLDLLAEDFEDEIVTVMVDEGTESGPSIMIGGTAQSGSRGGTKFWCQDIGDGLELAWHDTER